MGRRASDKLQYRLTILLAILSCGMAYLAIVQSIRSMAVSRKALAALNSFHEAVLSFSRPSPFHHVPHENPEEGPQ